MSRSESQHPARRKRARREDGRFAARLHPCRAQQRDEPRSVERIHVPDRLLAPCRGLAALLLPPHRGLVAPFLPLPSDGQSRGARRFPGWGLSPLALDTGQAGGAREPAEAGGSA